MKLIGKLQDGTVFIKKGHDDEQPFEFKIDEGNLEYTLSLSLSLSLILFYLMQVLELAITVPTKKGPSNL